MRERKREKERKRGRGMDEKREGERSSTYRAILILRGKVVGSFTNVWTCQ